MMKLLSKKKVRFTNYRLVKENAIIISKGEVIEGDKLQKLNSLKEYRIASLE